MVDIQTSLISHSWDCVPFDHDLPTSLLRALGNRILLCCCEFDSDFSHKRGRASVCLGHLLATAPVILLPQDRVSDVHRLSRGGGRKGPEPPSSMVRGPPSLSSWPSLCQTRVVYFSILTILNKILILSLYVSNHFLPVLGFGNFDFYLTSLLNSLLSGHVPFSWFSSVLYNFGYKLLQLGFLPFDTIYLSSTYIDWNLLISYEWQGWDLVLILGN